MKGNYRFYIVTTGRYVHSRMRWYTSGIRVGTNPFMVDGVNDLSDGVSTVVIPMKIQSLYRWQRRLFGYVVDEHGVVTLQHRSDAIMVDAVRRQLFQHNRMKITDPIMLEQFYHDMAQYRNPTKHDWTIELCLDACIMRWIARLNECEHDVYVARSIALLTLGIELLGRAPSENKYLMIESDEE